MLKLLRIHLKNIGISYIDKPGLSFICCIVTPSLCHIISVNIKSELVGVLILLI